MYVMGTAGHVDHGKSTLVTALSGIDPDRLPEEKARGMTIDLGFAWMTTRSGETIGIVDVPGHERFVKNMIAGVGAIDFVLLVIAADDGWMPQTAEHLAILRFLQVRRGIVAITKCTLVEPEWLDLVKTDAREKLSGAFPDTPDVPIIAVDSLSGQGLDTLRDAIDAMTRSLPPRVDLGRPRLYIDRVFAMAGRGAVVTGTLIDGTLETGQSIAIVPGGGLVRIRELQVHKQPVRQARPGQRLAVNLAGIDVAGIRRGQCLVHAADDEVVDRLWAHVSILPDEIHALERHRRVLVMLGTSEPEGLAYPLDEAGILPGADGFCEFRLASPIKARWQDRFVLRWPTPPITIGGGQVLDFGSPRRGHRDPDIRDRLQRRLDGTLESFRATELGKSGFCPREGFLRQASFSPDAVVADLQGAIQSRNVVQAGGWLFDPVWLKGCRRRLVEALQSFHREQPYRQGLNVAEWQSYARINIVPADAVAELMARQGEVVRSGDAYHLPRHEPRLPQEWNAEGDRLWGMLQLGGLQPPIRDELDASSVHAKTVVNFWIDTGRVVALGDGVILPSDLFASVREKVRAQLRLQPSLTAGQLRDLLGTTRKYAVPIGEALDREGITRREGDVRVLAEPT